MWFQGAPRARAVTVGSDRPEISARSETHARSGLQASTIEQPSGLLMTCRTCQSAGTGTAPGRKNSSTLVLIVVAVVPATVLAVIAMVVVIIVVTRAALAALALIFLAIALTHPLLLDEVHGLTASVVAPAVPAPVLLIDNRDVEVDRLLVHGHRRRGDYNRLSVDDSRRRVVADVDAAVDAGLIDANRNSDVGP